MCNREKIRRIIVLGNTIDKVRLLFRKDKESYLRLYRILGFFPHNIEIYNQAFLHKSQSLRTQNGLVNNERLEYLGDAVLGSIIADILYKTFDRKKEGFLTSTRSKIVQRETLNSVAKEMGLNELIKYSTRNSSHNSYMGGNAFEALIGAIYLDRGYRVCKYFLEHRIIGTYINLKTISKKEMNFKSKMLEWSQKNHVQSSFELTSQGYDELFSPVFESNLLLEGILAGHGKGYSKKESQQLASKEALRRIKGDSKFVQSILDAKAMREYMEMPPVTIEEPSAVANEPEEMKADVHIMESRSMREEIISKAEDAAFEMEVCHNAESLS